MSVRGYCSSTICALLGTALLCPIKALADIVWLTNGDRITGSLESMGNGKLKIKTPYADNIELAWSSVSTLLSEKPIELKNSQTGERHVIQLRPSTPGYVHAIAPGYDEKIAISTIDEFMQAKARTDQWNLTGNIDAGINIKHASTDSQNYDLSFNSKARKGKWRHDSSGTFNRDKEDNEVNTDNYSLRYAIDYMFHEQYFWQARTTYKRDWIEDLSRQFLIGTGPGYQLWDNPEGAFSVSLLAGGFSYGYRDGAADTHAGASLRWDYTRYFDDKTFALYSNGELGHSLDRDAIISLDAEVGLRYTLTSWSTLNVSYHHNLVNGTRDSLNEHILNTGVGLKW